jgi:hypothetical protein
MILIHAGLLFDTAQIDKYRPPPFRHRAFSNGNRYHGGASAVLHSHVRVFSQIVCGVSASSYVFIPFLPGRIWGSCL